MAVQDKLYTATDLEKMPDDGKIYELHDGELIEVAGSKRLQALIAAWIVYLLTQFVESSGLGGQVSGADGACILDRYNTRIPDVAYFSEEALLRQPAENSFFQGAPDLVVEVVSDSNTTSKLRQRVGAYLRSGARLVSLVYPETRTVEIYQPEKTTLSHQGNEILDGGDVLPGFKLPVSKLFERVK
jgi:Uma2 family endonuclease